MAKGKTKTIPFEVEATEKRTGVWEWEVEGVRWHYEERMGLNLSILHVDTDELQPVVCVPDLRAAGYFAQGVAAGMHLTERK